jgi:Spy/CpxP family protein refolding chaperone
MSERPLRRARALSAALLLAVFAAGALAGAAADRALRGGDHGRRGRGHRGLEAQMVERLDLEAGQREQIETILERRRAEAGAVWSEVKPRFNEVVARTRDDLSRVLRPEQLEEYDRLMAERLQRMERRYQSGGAGESREARDPG